MDWSDEYELDWSDGNCYQVGIIILSFMFFPIKNLEFLKKAYTTIADFERKSKKNVNFFN